MSNENKQNQQCTKILITVNEKILEQVKEYSYLGCNCFVRLFINYYC